MVWKCPVVKLEFGFGMNSGLENVYWFHQKVEFNPLMSFDYWVTVDGSGFHLLGDKR
uniref:Uncharacterized protein n=1 Tax=Rhizophagus irregularis (strain DAOM 181602 / DAOM 197198 / MUCL 43194) TaxID=747089 RepID=U9U6Q7_RHIID